MASLHSHFWVAICSLCSGESSRFRITITCDFRHRQPYAGEVSADEAGKIATAITWTKVPKQGSALTYPGVYCLRTTLTGTTDAELWKTYSMPANLEAVFRSLKTDLGLRPVFHRIERRVDAHLFLGLLACIFVHAIRL